MEMPPKFQTRLSCSGFVSCQNSFKKASSSFCLNWLKHMSLAPQSIFFTFSILSNSETCSCNIQDRAHLHFFWQSSEIRAGSVPRAENTCFLFLEPFFMAAAALLLLLYALFLEAALALSTSFVCLDQAVALPKPFQCLPAKGESRGALA